MHTTRDDTLSESNDTPHDIAEPVLVAVILTHIDVTRCGEFAVLASPETTVARLSPLFVGGGARAVPRGLADLYLSRQGELTITRTSDGVELQSLKDRSAMFVNGRPLEGCAILGRDQLRSGILLELGRRATLWLTEMDEAPDVTEKWGIRGLHPSVRALRKQILVAASSDSALIVGEPGSGKELVAAAYHAERCPNESPYLALNLASLTDELAASTLFGHTKGAFTGAAADRRGLFVDAADGAVFLDEIGACSLGVQASMLRLLEEREVMPIGAPRSVPFNASVVAATDSDLADAIARGDFRALLYYRLAKSTLDVPPLRMRTFDIPLLFLHFAEQFSVRTFGVSLRRDKRPWLLPAQVRTLLAYQWPGNIRELRNVAEGVATRCWGEDHASLPLLENVGVVLPAQSIEMKPTEALPAHKERADLSLLTKANVLGALELSVFSAGSAAKALGVSRTSMYALMAKHGIRRSNELEKVDLQGALLAYQGDVDAAALSLRISARAFKNRAGEVGMTLA
ncbi:MAG: DNA-binding NtrC family response regulator [Bradymonadia bacterium]